MTFYASDQEIARRLGLTADEWRKLLSAYSKEPAFKLDIITGKRAWPAIEAFLLSKSGVITKSLVSHDGAENWHGKQGW